jgi:acyl-CoA reductase-like NAD-dependent aldehyde dehydrogenase
VGFCVTLLKSALDITLTPQVMDQPNARVEVHRRPVGVVVGITPWNFPLFIGVQKWAPALILGNTFLWKPSPYTPLTALYCSAFLKDCFPPGVLSILSGDDKSDFNVGGYLTSHPKVNKITFTGSVRTGMRIMASAASDMKRLTLELGGNDAAIVRADCDPKETAKAIFGRAFANSGQVCVAIKRAFVQRSIYKKFCEELAAFAQTVKLGDGFEEGVMYGPLNNQMQLDYVKALVEDARGRGAKILSGGKQPGGKGYFYEPTIVADIAEGARLVDEEQFGPALPVIPYDTDDEAVQRANATQYGLGGSVWSKDVEAASKLAHRLRAGTVWVNEHFTITGGPFGGFKHSGIGRELGDQDVVAFTELQTLSFTK